MRIILTASALILMSLPAVAADLCKGGPRSQWLSKDEIGKKVAQHGYDNGKFVLAMEDGCLEAKLITADGKKVELYFEPVTGDLVQTKVD